METADRLGGSGRFGRFSFRRGYPEDAPALKRVLVEAFESYRDWAGPDWSPAPDLNDLEGERLRERLGEDASWCLMAETEGEPVGYVVLRNPEPEPQRAHVWHLFVLPACWGTGVAPHLLAEAMTEAARRGCTHAFLRTPRDHARARAFYRREGWTETGEGMDSPGHLDLRLINLTRPLRGY